MEPGAEAPGFSKLVAGADLYCFIASEPEDEGAEGDAEGGEGGEGCQEEGEGRGGQTEGRRGRLWPG